MKLLISYNL